MPLYEYQCEQCTHQFEKLVHNGETVACPECRSERLERLLSLPAKPSASMGAMPMACKSSGPPCGSACPRWQ